MAGAVISTFRFIANKFSSIKSGNSFFELIVFLCSYFDVFVASYMIDHVVYKLPINVWLLYGLLASAFVRIFLLLLFDEKGLS